jgi:hypothetical protein
MRKATLRGHGNLQKRYNFAAACYNLSQLLRKKFGCGTLKMAQATQLSALFGHFLAYGSSLGSFAKLSLLANRAFPLRRASFYAVCV